MQNTTANSCGKQVIKCPKKGKESLIREMHIKRPIMGMKLGSKKCNKQPRDFLLGITKPAIRRLARRGGVKRISSLIYDEGRTALRDFLRKVIKDTVLITESGRRSTVTSLDVVHALKRNGKTLYGFQ